MPALRVVVGQREVQRAGVGDRYAALLRLSEPDAAEAATGTRDAAGAGERLAARLSAPARAADLPATLRDLEVDRSQLPALAADAATQWTGTSNPRPFDAASALD